MVVKQQSKLSLVLIILFCDIAISFEPVTLGLTASAFGSVYYYFKDPIDRYSICQVKECCNDGWIPANFTKLRYELEEKLYGQHIALDVVVNALTAHWKEKQPQKPLTMSFHGWPGSGKNYVTKFIQESLFHKGTYSKFVHNFKGRVHFHSEDQAHKYRVNLHNWIKGNVTKCDRSLFIFDEVDKIPKGVLNSIKPFIDYNDHIDHIDYRKSVFIFLSNTGSLGILKHMMNLWRYGRKRKDVQLKDFEKLILDGAFNEEGGFQHSDTIKSNLIDHYIPFFPMEREHVELCIRDQFRIRDVLNPDKRLIDEVFEFVEWGPEPEMLFSTTGCKRISQKVAEIIEKYRVPSRLISLDEL